MIRTAIVNIIFCYFSVACFSQEEVIKLNVKAGNTYVFEVKSINSEISLNGNSQIAYKSNARVHFEVETINKDSITYTAQTVYYQAENTDTPIKSITDYIFPPIGYDEIENQKIYWVIIRMLPTMKIKYKADLKTNEIKLNNHKLFFDEVRKKLKSLGYNEELISRGIDYFNEKNSILEHVNHKNQILLYFNQARKMNSSQINSPFLNKTLTKSKKGEYFFSEDNSEFGTNYSKLTLSKKTGFLEQYIEAKNDTNNVKWIGTNIHSKLTETVYTFKEQFETNKDLFTFKCTIKNPQDSIVTIMFLDKPYGDDYSKRLLKLDENNQVTFQTKIQAPSFFYFASKSIKYTPKWVSSYYYIEPHDTLILSINETEENSLDISGTNSHVNKILRDLQKEEELFLYPGILSIPDISKRSQNPTQKFNSYLKNNNITLKNDIYSFLNTELVAIEYYFYFALLNKHHSPLQRSSFPFQNIETEKKMVAIAKEKIENFDIHDNYNDYGIYSRKMSNQYFNYYLNNLRRIQATSSMSSKHSLIKEFEVGKMILGGSVFYRVLSDRVISSIKKDNEYLIPPATYNLPEAIELLNLLTKQCNSEHYKQNLITFRNNRLNWESKNYIPDETFYKPDGSKLKLHEVINGKPTVLLISKNWGAYRYNLDDEAKKNPEIQYIMIVEGDNIVEWQKYLQRAAPVADQLFYLNENKSLDEIFLSIDKLYAVYDKKGHSLVMM